MDFVCTFASDECGIVPAGAIQTGSGFGCDATTGPLYLFNIHDISTYEGLGYIMGGNIPLEVFGLPVVIESDVTIGVLANNEPPPVVFYIGIVPITVWLFYF